MSPTPATRNPRSYPLVKASFIDVIPTRGRCVSRGRETAPNWMIRIDRAGGTVRRLDRFSVPRTLRRVQGLGESRFRDRPRGFLGTGAKDQGRHHDGGSDAAGGDQESQIVAPGQRLVGGLAAGQ